MPAPAITISDEVRVRLDAAREWLDVKIEWIEPGDPRCWGRAMGVWCVYAGPYGWQDAERRAAGRNPVGSYQLPPAGSPPAERASSESPDLNKAIVAVLKLAEAKWPFS